MRSSADRFMDFPLVCPLSSYVFYDNHGYLARCGQLLHSRSQIYLRCNAPNSVNVSQKWKWGSVAMKRTDHRPDKQFWAAHNTRFMVHFLFTPIKSNTIPAHSLFKSNDSICAQRRGATVRLNLLSRWVAYSLIAKTKATAIWANVNCVQRVNKKKRTLYNNLTSDCYAR